jgi:hypothetical protein
MGNCAYMIYVDFLTGYIGPRDYHYQVKTSYFEDVVQSL